MRREQFERLRVGDRVRHKRDPVGGTHIVLLVGRVSRLRDLSDNRLTEHLIDAGEEVLIVAGPFEGHFRDFLLIP